MAGIKTVRALQLVSYLDETAMNVAQELGELTDLYNYDVLVKLLSDRFDPASRVSCVSDPASMAAHDVIMRTLIHSRTHWI